MKRLIYISSLFVVISACQDVKQTTPEQSSSAIAFSVETSSMEQSVDSRADIVTSQTIDSFGVFAYNFVGDAFVSEDAGVASYMVNQAVTLGSDGVWSYSPLMNWSNTLFFYAYSPYVSDGSIVASTLNGQLIVDYTIPSAASAQYDLMVSSPCQQSDGDVNLSFSHQLSAISFAAVGDGERIVTALRMSGVDNSGRLTQSSDGTTSWSNKSCDSSNEFVADVIENITLSSTAKSLCEDNQTLMMIPQTLSSSAKLYVTTVARDDATDISTISLSFGEEPSEWLANCQYLYTMDIKTNYDGDLNTSVTTVDWVENDELRLW